MPGLYDNHNHCQFSFDGHRTTVEDTARSAARKGLAGICFTDHCDFYVPPMKAKYEDCVPEVFEVEQRDQEIMRVNDLIGNEFPSFRIFRGIEIGVQKEERARIAEHLGKYSFDQVIASVHYLDETDPFWGGYYQGKDWKTAYGHYLETLYEEMLWLGPGFDIMGHYDYVARYAPYPECSIFIKDFPDIMEAILKYLAENGKALEINTKTYQSYSGRVPVPDRNILLRFRELGGELISLGSDSHDARNVGFNFDKAAEFVKSCGFRYEAHFENRKPVMSRL
ncbi:MAG: histidinol-phosphatase HisJ family protein [Candidatus Cryptobacteroides sp.]